VNLFFPGLNRAREHAQPKNPPFWPYLTPKQRRIWRAFQAIIARKTRDGLHMTWDEMGVIGEALAIRQEWFVDEPVRVNNEDGA
jgi:hypothetical protein